MTGDQIAAVLAATGQQSTPNSPLSATPSAPASDTPPVITINGANPATINIGDIYSDLGATITGPQADLNLDIRTFLNGAPLSPIQIDTSAEATDTIEYAVTHPSGLAATSTRTVIVQAASAPTAPIPPLLLITPDSASSTTATSSAI